VEFNDTSTLWERKASIAKSINDNKIDVTRAFIGAFFFKKQLANFQNK